jgi:transposase-like protein
MRFFLHDGHPDDGWVPEMSHARGAKGSQYHPRLGAIILARLRQGETIRKICADADMPSAPTLHRWRHVHPEFGGAYERMKDERADHRRLHARLKRERWLEWARIEAKIGRRRTRTWVSGSRSTYEQAWAMRFCARVAKGEAVYRICADPQMPSVKAVYGWLRRHPEFTAMYTEAKREAVSWLAFQAEMAADEALDGVVSRAAFTAIKRRVARIEGRAGRLAARNYR